LHAFDEQRAWLRNRIGDPATVSAMYLRGGSVFVTVAVVGALFLTVSASSAPLKGAWSGADAWLIDAGRGLQRYFSFVQSVRGPTGVDFGPSAHITGKWATDSDVAVTIKVPPGSPATYWRAAAYDVYDGSGWVRSGDTRVDRRAGQQILEGTLDAPTAAGHVAVTVEVTPVGYGGTNVFSPGDVGLVDQATTLRLIGHDNHNSFYSTVEVPSSHTTYEVTGYVPTLGVADPKDLTKNKLRAAGTDYPADVVATYVTGGVPTGAIGPDARKLLEQLRARVPDGNPYDLAQATVDTLQSGVYHYDTDVHDLDCSKIGIVECFARYKRGYCQYYATTMAILLRAEGIPTRLVQGFLPTDRRNNVETLLDSNSHAWVQVYFPKFGWVDFDPTGGNVSRLPVIPNGPPVSIPPKTPKPSGTDEVNPSRPIGQPSGSTVPIGSTGGPGGAGSGPFILIALVLGLSVLALGFVTYRRGPRSASPDQAWRGVTRLAGRLGFAPRPTQTVYEYAGVLGDLIPVARPHLDTVAAARVEVVYGRRELGDDRLRALRESVGRLRIALLRLAFRRRERRAYRRGRRPGSS
jgi:transglutaminase-like putative cysteine protease